jgi:hypothetical protein
MPEASIRDRSCGIRRAETSACLTESSGENQYQDDDQDKATDAYIHLVLLELVWRMKRIRTAAR